MTENIYTAPQSELSDVAEAAANEFYVVSRTKFTVLFFATLGLYGVYWFYKNWAFYKATHGNNIWPIPRGIFSIFFAHSLFREVDKSLKQTSSDFNWNPSLMATMYVIFAILSNVLDRLSMKEIGTPYADVLSILVLLVIYVPLAKAQQAINISQNDADGKLNSEFTLGNYVWILLGAILWVFAFIGLLVIFGIMPAGNE